MRAPVWEQNTFPAADMTGMCRVYLDSKVPTTRRVEKTGFVVLEPGHMTHRYSAQSDSTIITNIISCAYAFTAMYYGITLIPTFRKQFHRDDSQR